MHEIFKHKNGIILLGPANSGKSSLLRTLKHFQSREACIISIHSKGHSLIELFGETN